MPVSTMPIVTPRPSQVGLASVKSPRPCPASACTRSTRGVAALGGTCGVGATGALGPRILERNDLVEVDPLDRVEGGDRLDLVGGDAREHVAEAVVAVQDRAALRLDASDDVAVGAGLRGDDHDDGALALRLRLREERPVVLREPSTAIAAAAGECCRARQGDDRKRGDHERAKGALRDRSHLFSPFQCESRAAAPSPSEADRSRNCTTCKGLGRTAEAGLRRPPPSNSCCRPITS